MAFNSIGENIKTLRIKKNITQYELGKAIGVSTQAVSKWERGGTPDVSILPAIADYFNISIDAIFGRKEPNKEKILEYLYNDVLSTNENEFEKACTYSWNIFKGLSKMQGLEDYNYCELTPDSDLTKCIVSNDTGIGWATCSNDFHMTCIFPEPKESYNTVLGSIEEYTHLFKILSDDDYLKFLFFLYKHSPVMFSKNYAIEKANIDNEKIDNIIETFKNEKWILEETVFLDSTPCVLYKPIHKEVFIFFMYFAKEFLSHTRLWGLSNRDRTNPYLR